MNLYTMVNKNKERNHHTVLSQGFFKDYFVHMRPYLLFVSGIAGYAGMAFSYSADNFHFPTFMTCLLSFFLGYGFGQALTDCFQIDTDTISSPYRPLVRGTIRKQDVMVVSIVGLMLISVPLVVFNALNLVGILLSAFGLLTYTYFKKNHTLIGPFWNSWIVALLPIMGFLSADSRLGLQDILSNHVLIACIIMTFSSYANFVVIGYLKDITADRETSYRTFPVKHGWNSTMHVGNINVLVTILSCSYIVYHNGFSVFSIISLIIAVLVAIYGQIYGLVTTDKSETNSAIPVASTVRSFILFHLAAIFAMQSGIEVLILGVVFYMFFELVMRWRPQKEQI